MGQSKMEIKKFEGFGRKLMVKFTCRRCKVEAYRPLYDCLPSDGPVRDLYDLKAPKEWEDGGFYYPTLCPECAKKYKRFMEGE